MPFHLLGLAVFCLSPLADKVREEGRGRGDGYDDALFAEKSKIPGVMFPLSYSILRGRVLMWYMCVFLPFPHIIYHFFAGKISAGSVRAWPFWE